MSKNKPNFWFKIVEGSDSGDMQYPGYAPGALVFKEPTKSDMYVLKGSSYCLPKEEIKNGNIKLEPIDLDELGIYELLMTMKSLKFTRDKTKLKVAQKILYKHREMIIGTYVKHEGEEIYVVEMNRTYYIKAVSEDGSRITKSKKRI